MPFNEFQLKQIENAASAYMSAHRPSPEIRPKLDYEIEVKNLSVILYEIRPHWQDSAQILKMGIAKTTYVKTSNLWKVLCRKRDLKWYQYTPMPTVNSIDEFFALVAEDAYHYFFG